MFGGSSKKKATQSYPGLRHAGVAKKGRNEKRRKGPGLAETPESQLAAARA